MADRWLGGKSFTLWRVTRATHYTITTISTTTTTTTTEPLVPSGLHVSLYRLVPAVVSPAAVAVGRWHSVG